MIQKERIRKIGIFRALYLGDMLCIIPAVRALKAAFPEASLTLIGLPWQQHFAERFHHYFDRFIVFPGWPGLPEQKAEPARVVDFLRQMQEQQFDLVLQMQGHGVITNSMCMLWGAATVAGLRKANEYCPDNTLFPVSEDDDHEILRYLKLTDALDIARQGTSLEFPFSENERKHFNMLAEGLQLPIGKYVCLHAGARDAKRRWPTGNFAHVGDYLAEKGYTIVLTGSEAESTILNEVAGKMRYPAINTIALLNDVSLAALAAIIAHSALLVSNDTGVSHIAAALKTPSVVIFSPFSDQGRWAPLNGALHRAISFKEAVDVSLVLHAAYDQLKKYDKALNLLFN